MSKHVVIIGGGVMGLCSAYYLQAEGHQVTIIDQSNMDAGASYVNAGYLSPSHLIPLAAPGVMKKGLRWMFNASSPLYIKPRFNADLVRWAWAFNRSCNPHHVKRAVPVIKDITVLSQELYDGIIEDEGFQKGRTHKNGLFVLCKTQRCWDEENTVITMAQELGLKAKSVDAQQIQKMQPKVALDVLGGAYYECDWHTTPQEFMESMKRRLKEKGVTFFTNERVHDVHFEKEKIHSIRTSRKELTADVFVLAAGAWAPQLSRKIGLRLLLEAGKGYRINSEKDFGITIPAILAERKIAVTPMNGFTRFAGTMEIAGIQQRINKVRVEAIARGTREYYPEIKISQEEKNQAACGLRPVTPDGLPYIGNSRKCSNLVFATGHAMLGWSMAAATGKLVQELIDGRSTSLDLRPFSPNRKF